MDDVQRCRQRVGKQRLRNALHSGNVPASTSTTKKIVKGVYPNVRTKSDVPASRCLLSARVLAQEQGTSVGSVHPL